MAFMAHKTYAIDRIEDNIAICECLQTGARITVDIQYLPPEANEGDLLRQEGERFVIDEAQTKQRLSDLTDRMNELFDKHKSP